MSRVGKNPVAVLDGVTVAVNGQDVKVKGPKGELSLRVHDEVSVALEDGGKTVRVAPRSESRQAKMQYPTTRMLINNMVIGVKDGYSKAMEIQGVGYRVNLQGKNLVLQMGYSHDIIFPIPEGIQITVDKQTSLVVSGADKQKVGQTAAKIRSYRKPEPYKGKGIRYVGEYVERKEGKKK